MSDLISRQAAIDRINGTAYAEQIKENMIFILRMLPPAQPERKTGKWNCSDDYYETGVCSACEWDVGEAYADCKKWFKFCPNCGADMRGEQE